MTRLSPLKTNLHQVRANMVYDDESNPTALQPRAKPAQNGTGNKDISAKGEVYDSVQNVDRHSASRRTWTTSSSKHFRHYVVAAILWLLVAMGFLPVRKLYFFLFKFLIWNKTQKMRNAVEPGSPLVISVDDVPWRI
jgi:hypothetical protein